MKPFFTNQILIEMNRDEVDTLYVLISNARCKFQDQPESIEFKKYTQMLKDVIRIQQCMPF